MTDHTSLDPATPGHPPGPGDGPCNSVPDTFAMPEQAGTGLVAIDAAAGLWLDVRDGIVVDLSQPARPRTRGALALGPLGGAWRVAERRLILSVRKPPAAWALDRARAAEMGDDELAIVDFVDPDAPAVVARTAVPGDVVLTALVSDAAGSRVYAVSDEIGDDCLHPTKRSFVRSFALAGERLDPLESLDLGEYVAVAATRGARLFVFDGFPQLGQQEPTPPSLRVIALDAADGALQASAPAATLGPFGFQPALQLTLDGDVLTLVALADEGQIHVQRHDTGDRAATALLSDCALPELDGFGGAWTLGDRTFVATWPAQVGSNPQDRNRMVEVDLACTTSERTNLWLVDVPDADALVELDFSANDAIEARLLSSAALEPVAVARVEIDPALGPFGRTAALPWASTLLQDAVSMSAESGATETGLLAVPLDRQVADPREATVQLFSISETTITARSTLAPATALAVPVEGGVATLAAGDRRLLTAFELDADAARASGELVLDPFYARGYALGDGSWLRLRMPLGMDRWRGVEELSEEQILHPDSAALASLEVVDGGDHAAHGAIQTLVEVNPYAQLVRAGDLFLSIANDEHSVPGTSRIEIFDFGDPREPARRGTLETDALWVQDNDGELRGPGIECLECDPAGGDGPFALVTPRAIALRGVRWVADGGDGYASFSFQVIDLGDPDEPAIGESFVMPEDDHALGAFVSGDTVYYRYKRPVEDEPGRVRFFVRRLDLADPAAPSLSEPINVPGDLVAVQGDAFYTVEVVQDDAGATLHAELHRLRVRDGLAQIEATYALGPRRPVTVTVRGDRVFVDLGVRLDAPRLPVDGTPKVPDPPTRLVVLDAEELTPLAEADLAYGALRIGANASVLLYAVWTGVLVVDAGDPQDARYLPADSNPLISAHVAFANEHALLTDASLGQLFDIDLTPTAEASP